MRTYLLSYDIKDNYHRKKMADLLLDYGHRVQYSVFEANLSPSDFTELTQSAQPILDPATDSLRIYPLCRRCLEQQIVYGKPLESMILEPTTIL